MRKVVHMTWNYRAKWRSIGIALGIDTFIIEAISRTHVGVEHCLITLLGHWLECRTKYSPSHCTLAKALLAHHDPSSATSTNGML